LEVAVPVTQSLSEDTKRLDGVSGTILGTIADPLNPLIP
jgi:hypothetical protein